METVAKGDFIELEFTGRINGVIFDSNVEKDLKQAGSELKPRKLILIVGEGMVVKGLDSVLEKKEMGKEYNVHVSSKEGFGPRMPSLVKTIPLHVFTKQKIFPEQGMTLALDNALVQIRAVSGARVIADFNNPLAGKDLDYEFKIIRKITDTEEKAKTFFEWAMRGVPEFSVNNDKVIVKGSAQFEQIVEIFKKKFKELVGKDLDYEIKVEKENKKQISDISPAEKEPTQQSL